MTEPSARALLRRFGQFADRFADCFSRSAQRDAASQYRDALFNDSERKSMQAMHGRLSDPSSYEALRHFITDSPWEAEPLWTRLREGVPVRRGILALDDTSFRKQGKHSVGVNADYGSTAAFRRGLEYLGLRYGVAIRWFLTMWAPGARRPQTAGAIAAQIPDAEWQRVTGTEGTKGPLAAPFAAVRVRPAKSRGERWLLCDRSLADDERKYYLLNLDATATLRALVVIVRSRSPIEQQYRELKR